MTEPRIEAAARALKTCGAIDWTVDYKVAARAALEAADRVSPTPHEASEWEKLRELSEKATPGPWRKAHEAIIGLAPSSRHLSPLVAICEGSHWKREIDPTKADHDARLIVAAVNLVRTQLSAAPTPPRSDQGEAWKACVEALEEIASGGYGKCPFDDRNFEIAPTTPCPVCGDIDPLDLSEDDPRKNLPSKCHQGGASSRAREALALAKSLPPREDSPPPQRDYTETILQSIHECCRRYTRPPLPRQLAQAINAAIQAEARP